MRLCGIIAEYNPFHNGHRYQIEQTRRAGATHIAVVMSGNFVQRGDTSIFSKWARAEACLLGGADLVAELPSPFALSPARDFAKAGVVLLNRLGIDLLSFGSECGDAGLLTQAAACCKKAEESSTFLELLRSGISYPQSRERAVAELFGAETAGLIRTPNNLLGIEYASAVAEVNPSIELFTIPRKGVGHHGQAEEGGITSASHLRRLILSEGLKAIRPYVPEPAYEIYAKELEQGKAPCSAGALDHILLYRLRTLSPAQIESFTDVAEGLENRIYEAGQCCSTFEECVDFISTRRYTKARVRRILTHILLDWAKGSLSAEPEYVRILGMNRRGAEILKRAGGLRGIPVMPKFADLHRAGWQQAEFERKAGDVYALCSPVVQMANREFTEKVVVLL